jgi:hypothetical protein
MIGLYFSRFCRPALRVGDGYLDLYAGLDRDGGDLLDDLGGRVQVNHPLVDPHLEPVPSLGSLSAGSLTGRDPQDLGGHAHGALGLEVLLLGPLDEVGAHLLQGLYILRGQGDPDTMDRGLVPLSRLLVLISRLKVGEKEN